MSQSWIDEALREHAQHEQAEHEQAEHEQAEHAAQEQPEAAPEAAGPGNRRQLPLAERRPGAAGP